MLTYGDRKRQIHVLTALNGIATDLRSGHRDATSTLVDLGEICQGILDARFQSRGGDDIEEVERLCAEALMSAALLFEDPKRLHPLFQAIDGLINSRSLPGQVCCTEAEGFALYALHPRQYLEAAKELRSQLPQPFLVVGLRSIGTALSAMVAQGLRTPFLPVTVRPSGHPFQRGIQASFRLNQEIKRAKHAKQELLAAVVDEGPGLSGSSFAGTIEWLRVLGFTPGEIHLFPGHPHPPGNQASAEAVRLWQSCPRHFSAHQPPSDCRNEDALAPGQWRELLFASHSHDAWPPSQILSERRKYLIRSSGSTPTLTRFVGLGSRGKRLFKRASRLAEAKLSPPVFGLGDGYLRELWIKGASNLYTLAVSPREKLLEHLKRHLSLLRTEFPTDPAICLQGPEDLLRMAVFNSEILLGKEAASTLQSRWESELPRLEREHHACDTDSRMHPWEWLVTPEGDLLKTDALDHHCTHDCVGPQDIHWDLAGAMVELDLDWADVRNLLRTSRRRLLFYRDCYLAFQAASFQSSADALGGNHENDKKRLIQRSRIYLDSLAQGMHRMRRREFRRRHSKALRPGT